MTKLLDLC